MDLGLVSRTGRTHPTTYYTLTVPHAPSSAVLDRSFVHTTLQCLMLTLCFWWLGFEDQVCCSPFFLPPEMK